MVVSNMTLVKIGAIGGIITVTMGMALRNKINENIRQTEYYREALKTVRSHKGAVYLLGEPIKEGRIDLDNQEKNYTKPDLAHYEVPVKGPKQKGTVYFWAHKDDGRWLVNRIELGLENEPDRRLLVKSSTDAENNVE